VTGVVEVEVEVLLRLLPGKRARMEILLAERFHSSDIWRMD